MSELQEGVVRFSYDSEDVPLTHSSSSQLLIEWRNRIHDLGWIGVDAEGVGFGNVSLRFNDRESSFLITASQTGHLTQLSLEHLCLITQYDLESYWLKSLGRMAPSSESLTHATLYACDERIQAVIHIHHPVYTQLLSAPITSFGPDIEYGTPALSAAIIHAYERTELVEHRLFISEGHMGGIYAYGATLEEALNTIQFWLNQYSS
jgi:L-ribulose-5-phosphate 4-epimerase